MTQFGARWSSDDDPALEFTGAGRAIYIELDPMPENGTLNSVAVRDGFDDVSDNIRIAVYTGVSNGTPANATLLEDLGQFAIGTSGSTNTYNSTTTPALASGTRYWIAIKIAPSSGSFYQPYESADPGTNDLTGAVWYGSDESPDEANAWDATCTNPTGNNTGRYHHAYINYTATDSTAPTLSSPTAAANGSTACTGSVSTDEGNGTLYWVVTTSSTGPSAAQVQAGQDHNGAAAPASGSQAVSATGVQNISDNGLTAGTTYYIHYQHKDAATNNSTVSTSASFTTTGGTSDAGIRSGVGFVTFVLKRVIRRYAG